MKINVQYTSTKWYDHTNINQWAWSFRKYKFVRGFNVRILGVSLNVRERNATEKLIGIARANAKK